jgi:hypothetical protein
MKITCKRWSPGSYTVSVAPRNGGYCVDITYHEHLNEWVARACWTRDTYTDGVPTLRDAKRSAFAMIEEEKREEVRRAEATRAKINAELAADRADLRGVENVY